MAMMEGQGDMNTNQRKLDVKIMLSLPSQIRALMLAMNECSDARKEYSYF